MRKVFISGNFNILHPGHIRLFRYSKGLSPYLVVGVFSDLLAGNNSFVAEDLRLESIKSNNYVDDVILITNSLEETIRQIKPDFILKGKEHENKFNIEEEIVSGYGGNLVFSSGEVNFTSFDLMMKTIDNYNFQVPNSFITRHSIVSKNLTKLVRNFSKLKIIVIGDLIVDEYVSCDPLGMSQEDPTLVVKQIESQRFIGGAGIVAAHASNLGANVNLISVSGEDETREFALSKLKEYNVNSNILIDNTRVTTLKKRYRAKGKTLLRVSHLNQTPISTKLQNEILKVIELASKKVKLLIFSDFNYGCLPTCTIEAINKICVKNKIMVVADSQSSSQIGDISRFKNSILITPTEREARISIKDNENGLVVLAEKLSIETNSSNIFLKIGEDGVLILAKDAENNNWKTDRLPALNPTPKDVSGAGDSMLTTGAMVLALGGNIWESALIGSIAAGIQVGRVGNKPLKIDEIIKNIENAYK